MVTGAKRPFGIGRTSLARRLRTGSSGLLFSLSSLRSFARTQPFWTKTSLPSGRTSEIVTCRSAFGFDDLTHARTSPAPTTVVGVPSGSDTYERPLPGGGSCHWYGGVAVHSPSVPAAVSPLKSVSGRACASHVNASAPGLAGFVSVSAPPGPKYHERAIVPGTGRLGNDCSKPGYGSPGF